jgi:transcription elongation factor Elf1
MSQGKSFSKRIPKSTFDRPPCPRCGALLVLVRIDPAKPKHDRRTFECAVCDYSETVVVKYQ